MGIEVVLRSDCEEDCAKTSPIASQNHLKGILSKKGWSRRSNILVIEDDN